MQAKITRLNPVYIQLTGESEEENLILQEMFNLKTTVESISGGVLGMPASANLRLVPRGEEEDAR